MTTPQPPAPVADEPTDYAPFVRHRDSAPAYWSGDILWTMLATAQDTAGAYSAMEQLCAERSGPPLHLHATQDETFYVLDGTVDFTVGGDAGGRTFTAGPGAFVAIPKGTAHRFTVTSPTARVLNAYYPAGFEQVILGTATPATRRTLPPPGLPAPDMARGRQLAEQYGMVFLHDAPPPAANAGGPQPFVITREEAAARGAAYWSVGILWTLLATVEDTGGVHSLLDELLPHGPAAPPHRHEAAEELLYLLDGEATFYAGPEMRPLRATAGAFVAIPRRARHAFRIDSPTARLLNVYTPAGFEHTIPPAAAPATAPTLPPASLPPTDPAAAVAAIADAERRYPAARTTLLGGDFGFLGRRGD